MPTKRKTTTKRRKPSAKQKAQQAKMKKAIKIAKEHQRKNPNKKWQQCVKYGWSQV